jgi:hypothetical protein
MCTASRKFSRKSDLFSVPSAAARSISRTPRLAQTSRDPVALLDMFEKPSAAVLLIGNFPRKRKPFSIAFDSRATDPGRRYAG